MLGLNVAAALAPLSNNCHTSGSSLSGNQTQIGQFLVHTAMIAVSVIVIQNSTALAPHLDIPRTWECIHLSVSFTWHSNHYQTRWIWSDSLLLFINGYSLPLFPRTLNTDHGACRMRAQSNAMQGAIS